MIVMCNEHGMGLQTLGGIVLETWVVVVAYDTTWHVEHDVMLYTRT